MLWKDLLATVLVAAPLVHGQIVMTDGDLEHNLKELQQRLTINSNNRPYYDQHITRENSCPSMYGSCEKTDFFYRHFLQGVNRVEIKPEYHVDSFLDNSGNQNNATIFVTKSTALTKAITENWKIGGKIEKSFSSFSLEISSEYSNTYSMTTMTTETVDIRTICNAGKKCSFSTATLYAIVRGLCNTEPYYRCGWNAYNVCKPGIPSCAQFQDYCKNNCVPSVTNLHIPCTVTMPLLRNDNMPVKISVLRTH